MAQSRRFRIPLIRKQTLFLSHLHPFSRFRTPATAYSAKESHQQSKTKSTMEVKTGDKVRVHYSGRLLDGTLFDSSEGREPLEFTVGAGQMIKGFDTGVQGMRVGDRKTIQIPPEEAYGHRDEEAIIEFPAENVPSDMTLEPGMQLTLRNQYGQPVPVVVLEVKAEVVIMDANHMLAGQELVFDVELVDIVGGTPLIITP
jgi:peptidylprolyl isomerase